MEQAVVTPIARPRVSRLVWVGICGLLAACEPDPQTQDLDLTRIFALGEKASETESIDFGTPGARSHLVRGWGFNQRTNDGGSFVWGTGERSVLRIQVGEPRELRLRFRCWPAPLEGLGEPSLEVFVAGGKVGASPLQEGPAWYAVRVPRANLVAGENRIEIRYSRHAPGDDSPAGVSDRRAVAFDLLEIANARSFGPPTMGPTAEAPRLRIPFRSSLAFYWMLPKGARLEFGGIAGWTARPGTDVEGRLELEVQRAGGPVTARAVLADGAMGAGSAELPPTGGAPVRVVLRSVLSGGAPEEAAGFDLLEPVLRTPREPGADGPAMVAPARLPDVFVYLIDTLRPDHLGIYGYSRPTSPHIDAFARDATLFQEAVAQTSWTRPAVASVFTGLHPRSHGVVRPDRALADGISTLPEVLAGLGYQTWGVTTNGNVAPAFGFGRGFERYQYLAEQHPVEMHQLSDRVNETFFGWLDERRDRRPLFGYLHTTDPHSPYTPRSPYRERLAGKVKDPEAGTRAYMRRLQLGEPAAPGTQTVVRALYDAEIAFNDAQFGAFLEKLKELGRYASSLIVLLSDHGEAFAEHGSWQHGTTLYSEVLAIPLVIKFPDGLGRGRVVSGLARQIDVLPTILDAIGQEAPAGLEGRSLLPEVLDGAGPRPPVTAFSHLSRRRGEWESATQLGRQLIRTRSASDGAERIRLFELDVDPLQWRDVAAARPVWRGYLLSQLEHLESLPRRHEDAPAAEIDPALRERLEALGYL